MMMQDFSGPVLVREAEPGEADSDAGEDITCAGSGSLTGIRVRRLQATRFSETPGHADDIIAYWERLRAGRTFPARKELDKKTLCFYWPHSVIFHINDAGRRVEVEAAPNPPPSPEAGWRRPGGAGAGGQLQFIVTEWLMPLVRAAASRGIAVDETTFLPLAGGSVRHRGVALPFGEDGVVVDHVLTHIIAPDEPAAF
ncbi:MAG: hypothetical protein ACTSUD_11300 [Alphaproteobacteria bacterium]